MPDLADKEYEITNINKLKKTEEKMDKQMKRWMFSTKKSNLF